MSARFNTIDRAKMDANYILQSLGSGNVIVTSIDSTHAGFKSISGTSPILVTNDTNNIFVALSPVLGIRTISGTTDTLLTTDNGKLLVYTSATDITLTVPAGLGAGFKATILQTAAGKVIFTASSTTILNIDSFTKTKGIGAIAEIISGVTNIFSTIGQMQA